MENNGMLLNGIWTEDKKSLNARAGALVGNAHVEFKKDSYTVIFDGASKTSERFWVLPEYLTDSVNTDAFPQGTYQCGRSMANLVEGDYAVIPILEGRILKSVQVQIGNLYEDYYSNILTFKPTHIVTSGNLDQFAKGFATATLGKIDASATEVKGYVDEKTVLTYCTSDDIQAMLGGTYGN